LEAAQAPVTLELIEALGIGLQTPSLFFMTSLATSEAVDEDAIQGLTRRMAVDEMRKRFGASLDRSGIAAVVRNAELLDDEQLWVLVIVADALFKAGVLEEQDDDDEWPRLLRAASRHTTTRRRGGIDKEGKRGRRRPPYCSSLAFAPMATRSHLPRKEATGRAPPRGPRCCGGCAIAASSGP